MKKLKWYDAVGYACFGLFLLYMCVPARAADADSVETQLYVASVSCSAIYSFAGLVNLTNDNEVGYQQLTEAGSWKEFAIGLSDNETMTNEHIHKLGMTLWERARNGEKIAAEVNEGMSACDIVRNAVLVEFGWTLNDWLE